MSTFVLVHGAWHGAWCWEKVVPLLQEAGHGVVVPDLPGHGEDGMPISELSMRGYADRVIRTVDEQPEPVVLVGHSMGGIVVSLVAEARPDRLKKLVYLRASCWRTVRRSSPSRRTTRRQSFSRTSCRAKTKARSPSATPKTSSTATASTRTWSGPSLASSPSPPSPSPHRSALQKTASAACLVRT